MMHVPLSGVTSKPEKLNSHLFTLFGKLSPPKTTKHKSSKDVFESLLEMYSHQMTDDYRLVALEIESHFTLGTTKVGSPKRLRNSIKTMIL